MPITKPIILPRRMLAILSAIFGLVVADGIIINFLISQGLAWEWNPFLRGHVGTDMFLLIKATAALLCMIVLWFLYKRSPKLVASSSIAICLFYTLVVYGNIGAVIAAHL